jgi:diacylglycerol kinase
MKNLKNSLQKCVKSFDYAITGIGHLFRHGNNIRYQLAAAAIAVLLGVYLEVNNTEWHIIITLIGLVLMAEAFNTAIEVLCDIVNPDWHVKIGMVKDISAGAVLLISISAGLVGLLIFGDKFIHS